MLILHTLSMLGTNQQQGWEMLYDKCWLVFNFLTDSEVYKREHAHNS